MPVIRSLPQITYRSKRCLSRRNSRSGTSPPTRPRVLTKIKGDGYDRADDFFGKPKFHGSNLRARRSGDREIHVQERMADKQPHRPHVAQPAGDIFRTLPELKPNRRLTLRKNIMGGL